MSDFGDSAIMSNRLNGKKVQPKNITDIKLISSYPQE